MKFRDVFGHELQYGDIVENLDTRDIGIIKRGSINYAPVMYILKRFSWKDLQYKDVDHVGAMPCYERTFMPEKSKVYWFLHRNCIPNIELLKHGDRNRRIKEI